MKLGNKNDEEPQNFTLVLSKAGYDSMGRHGLETHHAGFRELTDAPKPKARPDTHIAPAAVSSFNDQLGRKRANEALPGHTQFSQLERSRIMAGGFSCKTKNAFSKHFTEFPTTGTPFSCPSHHPTPPTPPREMQPSYCLLVNKEVIHLRTPLLSEYFQEKQVFKYLETGTHT